MTSNTPVSASARAAFANPQPAPVSASSQATSPPTKQSLKSWWKGFRPPQKSQEAQGNSHIQYTPSPKHPRSSLSNESFLTIGPRFSESSMTEDGPSTAGVVPADVLGAGEKQASSETVRTTDARTKKQRKRQSKRVAAAECSLVKRAHASTTEITSTKSASSNTLLDPFSSVSKAFFRRFFRKPEVAKITIAVEQPTGIFGVPLRQSITYANVAISLVDAEGKAYIYGYVPIVVAKCGVFLKEKATNVEGIFRLSGSEKRIKELKNIFDSPDRYGKGLDWAGYTVHDAANVLRRYLNQLPEPIVPLDLYDRFRAPLRGHTKQAVGDNEGPQLDDDFDVGKAIVTYQKLITELPPLNLQLLLYILDLLAVFASKSDENRMNSQNLAAIFQPGLLSHPQHDMAPSEYRLSQDVLIFLIENQDHFLIGMRGTAADEKTVQEVQRGATPPLGSPTTPRGKGSLGRSASTASAGADSVRKFGGIRRNVSVSSRNSRQSNGAPSPASPSYGTAIASSSGGLGRSNTLPSKKSPGIPQGRVQKTSGSPSPAAENQPTGGTSPAPVPASDAAQGSVAAPVSQPPRGLSPAVAASSKLSPVNTSFPATTTTGLAPPSPSATASQERLADHMQEVGTPTKERNLSSMFSRSPTVESSGEKKQPNKLRKKRIPSSSNPSAHSSTHSLGQSDLASPGLRPVLDEELTEQPDLENPTVTNTVATPPALEKPGEGPQFPEQQTTERALKAEKSPVSSLHSRSSFNDQSDLDHHDDPAAGESKERRSRWRLSRRRDDSQSILNPPRPFGSDAGAGTSSSSIGSASRPRKSMTSDANPVGSEATLVNPIAQASHDSLASPTEEKKGPLGWIKNKMREKREEKDAEKERTKSPSASSDRQTFPIRGKSVEIKREDQPTPIAEEPVQPPVAQPQQ